MPSHDDLYIPLSFLPMNTRRSHSAHWHHQSFSISSEETSALPSPIGRRVVRHWEKEESGPRLDFVPWAKRIDSQGSIVFTTNTRAYIPLFVCHSFAWDRRDGYLGIFCRVGCNSFALRPFYAIGRVGTFGAMESYWYL